MAKWTAARAARESAGVPGGEKDPVVLRKRALMRAIEERGREMGWSYWGTTEAVDEALKIADRTWAGRRH